MTTMYTFIINPASIIYNKKLNISRFEKEQMKQNTVLAKGSEK